MVNGHQVLRVKYCHCCGGPGGQDWCGTCEIEEIRPPSAFGYWTPICTECLDMGLICRVCNTVPRNAEANALAYAQMVASGHQQGMQLYPHATN